MKLVVIECETCEKLFETEENSIYCKETLCPSCFEEWPVIIDCDTENKF